MKFAVAEWKPVTTSSIYGFAAIVIDGWLRIDGIAVRDGKSGLWAAFPTKNWTDNQGKVRYDPIVSFEDKEVGRRLSDALIDRLRSKYPENFQSIAA